MNTVTELMLNHRSIRKYQKKMISVEIKEEIIRCAQMAPTSSYFQAYTIIEINDSKEKKALAEAAGGQDCVLCLGYPDENPDVKPRLPIHMVWKKDFYDSSFSPAYLNSYNKEVSSYFDKLTDGEDQYNWIERCSHALKTKPRYEVSDFAHQAGLLIN